MPRFAMRKDRLRSKYTRYSPHRVVVDASYPWIRLFLRYDIAGSRTRPISRVDVVRGYMDRKRGGAGGNRSMEKASNRVGRGVDVRKYRIRRHRID